MELLQNYVMSCKKNTDVEVVEAGWCVFGSDAWMELLQNYGMSCNKNTDVEVVE